MLKFGILVGIYSYCILLLGIFGKLYQAPIIVITIFFSIVVIITFNRSVIEVLLTINRFGIKEKLLLVLGALLVLTNLIGALGPELAFDALWYHLTIPKIYLDTANIFFIKGGLFYYSAMPRLTEMLYVSSLSLGNEISSKLIHFLFGLLTLIAVYKIARVYLSRSYSFLAALLFYSNLVVAWLSITAYTDLTRAFFEACAFYCFIKFDKNRKIFDLILIGIFVGLAISAKLLSIGSIAIFASLFLLLPKFSFLEKIKLFAVFLLVTITVALPWLILSYLDTGNPIYPLFTHLGVRNFTAELLSPFSFTKTLLNTFVSAFDPISPVYLIAIPLIFLRFNKIYTSYKNLLIYTIFAYLIWYFSSQDGGTRFLVPYLPVFSVMTLVVINGTKDKFTKLLLISVLILIFVVTIFYRMAANIKYLPVIFGLEAKQEFLLKNLNFDFGDFYDENSEIKKIVKRDRVLVLNFHNLYYADFSFTLEEWSQSFSYVLIQDGIIPEKYKNAKRVYENTLTHVILYKL